jgi:phenylacetate-CoA ligase
MKYYNPDIETLPLAKMRKLQGERLQKLAHHVYQNVPFYKKQFDQAGIKPGDLRSVEDLHKLPFTKKNDLRDNYPFDLFAVPQDQVVRIHASSGTTGKPTVVGYTRDDLEVFSEVVARSLVAAGCRPGMKLQNAYGYGLFTGGLGLHYGGEKLGMAVIPVSGGMTDRQIRLLRDFQPDAISCTPSYAQTLTEEIRKRGISLDELNLKYAILGAEPWTEAVREDVQEGLGVKASNIYGLSEIIGPGVSQEEVDETGTGSYIWEDHFYPEVVDKDTGEPLPEGEYGVLCFTTLTKQAMPLFRYWTNDITNIYYEHSEKRTHVKMGSILGRSDDMLIIRGVNFFHTQIEDLLPHFPDLSPHYQVVVTREKQMDAVEVRIEVDEPLLKKLGISRLEESMNGGHDQLQELKGSFRKKIKDNIGLSMKITLEHPGDIPRSEGGKLSRVKDLRKI